MTTVTPTSVTPTSVTLGPVRRLLLLGGGELLYRLAALGRQRGLAVDVVAAPRHGEENIPSAGKSLREALPGLGIKHVEIAEFAGPEARRLVGDIDHTLALSIGAPWIFRAEAIGWFAGRLFNLHGTRLPVNRGGGGYSWQILMGDRLGCCQVHRVDGGLDTGPLLASEEFIFPPACRTPQDYMAHAAGRYLALIGGLLETLTAAPRAFALAGQPEYLATYWPRLHTPSQAWIDWRWQVPFIERFLCAFDAPHVGAQTLWNGRTVRLRRAFANFGEGEFHPFQAGLVSRNNGRWLNIAAAGGSLVVEDLRDENGAEVLTSVRPGDAFATPAEKLQGLANRVQFDALGLKK